MMNILGSVVAIEAQAWNISSKDSAVLGIQQSQYAVRRLFTFAGVKRTVCYSNTGYSTPHCGQGSLQLS